MHPAYTKLRLPPPKGEGKVPGTEWRHYKHAIHQNTPNLKYILPLRVQNRIKEAKNNFFGSNSKSPKIDSQRPKIDFQRTNTVLFVLNLLLSPHPYQNFWLLARGWGI